MGLNLYREKRRKCCRFYTVKLVLTVRCLIIIMNQRVKASLNCFFACTEEKAYFKVWVRLKHKNVWMILRTLFASR